MNQHERPDAITATCDRIYTASYRKVFTSGDFGSTWYEWNCPLDEVVAIGVDGQFLMVAGGNQVAVSITAHKGRAWSVLEVPGQIADAGLVKRYIYVCTTEGRLFEGTLHHRRSLLDRLGFRREAPTFELREHSPGIPATLDVIEFGAESVE